MNFYIISKFKIEILHYNYGREQLKFICIYIDSFWFLPWKCKEYNTVTLLNHCMNKNCINLQIWNISFFLPGLLEFSLIQFIGSNEYSGNWINLQSMCKVTFKMPSRLCLKTSFLSCWKIQKTRNANFRKRLRTKLERFLIKNEAWLIWSINSQQRSYHFWLKSLPHENLKEKSDFFWNRRATWFQWNFGKW